MVVHINSFFFFRSPVCISQGVSLKYFSFLLLLKQLATAQFAGPITKYLTSFKVAPRVEKTEVFIKGRHFANRTYIASCIMRKHYFLLWRNKK